MNHDTLQHESAPRNFWGTRYAVGLLVLGAIAAYFLLSEHRAHFLGALPLLLLLACPLMHVFMHHGHGEQAGGHAHHHDGEPAPNTPAAPPPSKTGERP